MPLFGGDGLGAGVVHLMDLVVGGHECMIYVCSMCVLHACVECGLPVWVRAYGWVCGGWVWWVGVVGVCRRCVS